MRCWKPSVMISLFVFQYTFIAGNTYYVAKDGDDTNPGSETTPFKSIAAASMVMQAGDTCFIKEGTYRETLSPSAHGTADNPICYIAYADDSVTVSAVDTLGGWTLHSGTIYKVQKKLSMGIERRMLYFNSELMDIARWPNNTDNDPYTPEALHVTGGSDSHISYGSILDINWTGGYMWYLGAHSGASWTRQITSNNTTEVHFTEVDINAWPFTPHNPTIVRNGHRGIFYLFGKLEALNQEREWFYDDATNWVYLQAPGNIDPDEGIVEYSMREHAMYITRNFIVVDGINAFGGKVTVSGSNCQVRNGRLMHCLQRLDELDNTDAQIGEGAVNLLGSNNIIERNIIEYSASNGVANLNAWAGSSDNTIRNNVIRNVNTIGNHSCAIRSNCPGTIVHKNTVSSCGRDGIYTSGAHADISYNNVYDCMKMNNDGGVFYTVGNDDLKNSVIHHNWFHDSWGPDYADGRAAGIYLDNNSKGYDVYRNVVWNVTWAGIQFNWYNTNFQIVNNTLWNVESAMGRWANGHTMVNITIQNNFASSEDWIGTHVQNNLIDSEDPFIASQWNNFIPADGSALIDQGVEYSPFTNGYMGVSPDLGAYERDGDYWMAGADWIGTEAPNFIHQEQAGISPMRLVPNPVGKHSNILLDGVMEGELQVVVYTMQGKPVYSEQFSSSQLHNGNLLLQGIDLQSGIYVVRASNGCGVSEQKLIVH